jgi:hypothetical protein
MANPPEKKSSLVIAIILSVFAFGYLAFWILHLYPTLINDEYSALDFVYRAIKTHDLTPPPHRFYKPYSLIFGFLAFAGGPLAYELVAAAFAAGLVFVFYLCIRNRLNPGFTILTMLMLIFAVDLFDNTIQAIVMVPGAFFIFAAAAAGMQIPDRPGQWKRYSILGFLGGLARPESWLLAFPLLWWLFPKNLRQAGRWMLAPAVIALSAGIWFGKDWLLTHDVLLSLRVARYDKMIGTGADFGLGMSLYWFHHFLSHKLSTPFEIFCCLGFMVYVWDHRKQAHKDPFIVITVMLFLFLYLSIWRGLYPQMRFFFPLGVFLLFFAGWLMQRIFIFLTARKLRPAAYILVILLAAEYFFWCGYRLATVEYKALSRESEVQKQMVKVADYFRPILAGKQYRILMSGRRDEEFSWLLRDLPVQHFTDFREAYYFNLFEGKNFLDFDPQWIVWLPNDFQYEGVNEMFTWLNYQDRTELSGHVIELQKTINDFRIFTVNQTVQ